MAQPDRDVYVMVGDGSYLMMAQEIATAVQEGIKLTVILLDNHGYSSIGGLSASVGCAGFGTQYRVPRGNPASSTATWWRWTSSRTRRRWARGHCEASSRAEIEAALAAARKHAGVSVIVIPVDRDVRVRSGTSPGGTCRWPKHRLSMTSGGTFGLRQIATARARISFGFNPVI